MPSHGKTISMIAGVLLLLLVWGCTEPPPKVAESKRQKSAETHLVALESVQLRSVSTAYERTGSLRALRRVRIHNQEEGRINFFPLYEGDAVVQGELLVGLEDSLLKAHLDKAIANTRLARVNLKRILDLVNKRAASEEEKTKAQTALDVAVAEQQLLQTRLEYTRIKAPISGMVTERNAEPGDVVEKHSHLLTLADPSTLMTEIHISELLLPHLENGDPVSVRIDALGDQIYPGVIQRIHPELNPRTRQGVVEVALQPVPTGARAGQFTRVTLETARIKRILVSFDAIRRDADGEFVFLINDDGSVTRTPVRSGIRAGNNTEILEGLEVGQQVVNRGFLGLTDGKKVKPVNITGGLAANGDGQI